LTDYGKYVFCTTPPEAHAPFTQSDFLFPTSLSQGESRKNMRKTLFFITLAAVVIALGPGCFSANDFLVGATTSTAPKQYKAHFKTAKCMEMTGKVIYQAPLNYYLTDSALYEIDNQGNGARITNHWSDPAGVFYFVHVKDNAGWLYLIPHDPQKVPVRLEFAKGSYKVNKKKGALQPVGKPYAGCVLQKQ